jgi:hypothetical protein
MSDDVVQALEGCLSPWESIGRPIAINYRVKPGAEYPLQQATLRFLVRDDDEITSWMTPREIGITNYLPLSAATLLLSTDAVFEQAVERISVGMLETEVDVLVVPGAAIFMSRMKFIKSFAQTYGVEKITAQDLIRVAMDVEASAHTRVARFAKMQALVDEANGVLYGALMPEDIFQVDFIAP